MIRAIQLLFSPGETWKVITESKRSVATLLGLYVVPLLLLAGFAEGYARLYLKVKEDDNVASAVMPQDLVIRLEIANLFLGVVMVFAGAKMIAWISESFHFKPLYLGCFTVAAYGFGPVFLARFLNCIPGMNPWITPVVGTALSVYILYQGVGIVLQPEQTKGFGLYILVAVVFTLLSIMAHMLSLMALQGKIPL